MADTVLLNTREALRRAFYRLTDSSTTDDALEEHDSVSDEAVNLYLQHGIWAAQTWVLTNLDPWRWVTSRAAVSWSGSDSGDGQYMALPSTFLRLLADEEGWNAALYDQDGEPWGKLIKPESRHRARNTASFYLMNERLYKVVGALGVPTSLYMDYNARHDLLLDTTETPGAGETITLDFPVVCAPLIVAFAAMQASSDAWLPGGQQMEQRIMKALAFQQQMARLHLRRTRQGPKDPTQPRRQSNNPNLIL